MFDQFCRQATAEELATYNDILYPLQDVVFEASLIFEDAIYLTGGAVLARFHCHHCLSEDLDFFTQGSQSGHPHRFHLMLQPPNHV
ncbi:hypothetical protein [Caldilinea sp.]|uniref:hypothetical protein n=1 Tax=Caldilinea sp. TaxID=2293560 RepID=UPI002B972AA7|nr:hypothetical protein [Anaerolineales bacterium]HQY94103.1 hypothetical protein [Caldilinea sp.]